LFESVIFATDVRVSFDEWKKAMVATSIAKTILIVNPGALLILLLSCRPRCSAT